MSADLIEKLILELQAIKVTKARITLGFLRLPLKTCKFVDFPQFQRFSVIRSFATTFNYYQRKVVLQLPLIIIRESEQYITKTVINKDCIHSLTTKNLSVPNSSVTAIEPKSYASVVAKMSLE